jgi:hypothetical protein
MIASVRLPRRSRTALAMLPVGSSFHTLTKWPVVGSVDVGVGDARYLNKHATSESVSYLHSIVQLETYLYSAADTVLALTVFEFRLHHATCIA